MLNLRYSDTKKSLININGGSLAVKELPIIRPTEKKEITLTFSDITIPESAVIEILGDTDFKGNTAEKVQGTNIERLNSTSVYFCLETTQSYLTWLNSISDPNGLYIIYLQVRIFTETTNDVYLLQFRAGGIVSSEHSCFLTVINMATLEDVAFVHSALCTNVNTINNRIDVLCSNLDNINTGSIDSEYINTCMINECNLTDTKLNNLCALIDVKISNIEGISGITPEYLNACFLLNCSGEDTKLNNLCSLIDIKFNNIVFPSDEITGTILNSCMLLNCSNEDVKLNNLCNLLCSYDDRKYDKVENYKLVLNCDLTKNIFVNVLDCQTYQNITHYCNVLYFIFDV